MTTTDDLNRAVDESPLDAGLRDVYADSLLDAGSDTQADVQRQIGAALRRVRPADLAALPSRLASANGQRRERLLTLRDVARCVRESVREGAGWDYVAGGTAANAYGYRAYRTVCLCAVRSDGTVRIGVAVGDARKSASPVSPFGLRRNSKPSEFREWADRE